MKTKVKFVTSVQNSILKKEVPQSPSNPSNYASKYVKSGLNVQCAFSHPNDIFQPIEPLHI
jgi:hypothetical protein